MVRRLYNSKDVQTFAHTTINILFFPRGCAQFFSFKPPQKPLHTTVHHSPLDSLDLTLRTMDMYFILGEMWIRLFFWSDISNNATACKTTAKLCFTTFVKCFIGHKKKKKHIAHCNLKEIKQICQNELLFVSFGIWSKCMISFWKFSIRSIFISEEHSWIFCNRRKEKQVGILGWLVLGCGSLDRWYESGAVKEKVHSYFIQLLAIVYKAYRVKYTSFMLWQSLL